MPNANKPNTSTTASATHSIILREATIDDLDAINHVIREAVMGWQLTDRVKRLAIPGFLYDALDFEHMVMLVAIDKAAATYTPATSATNDVIVGFPVGIGVLDTDWHNEQINKTALLHGLFVSPTSQHRGIGRQLLMGLEQYLKQHSICAIAVKAHKEAVGFFLANGFTKTTPADSSGNTPGETKTAYENYLSKQLD